MGEAVVAPGVFGQADPGRITINKGRSRPSPATVGRRLAVPGITI